MNKKTDGNSHKKGDYGACHLKPWNQLFSDPKVSLTPGQEAVS